MFATDERRIVFWLAVLAAGALLMSICTDPTYAQENTLAPPTATLLLTVTATVAPTDTPFPTPTATPTFWQREEGTILSDLVAPLAVLVAGGILGAVGTYVFKPRLEDWGARRKAKRQAQEEERLAARRTARQRQITDARARNYLKCLVAELRDVKILDMTQPLDLEHSYVRLQVREGILRYPSMEEEALLSQVERDPSEWLRLRHEWRERGARTAILPRDALRQHHLCAVLGDPGAGKTTMLRHLALCAAQGRLASLPAFPLFVSLHRFVQSGQESLLDFVCSDLDARYGFPAARPYVQGRLEAGKVLLLLDGLDEVNIGQDEEEAESHYRRTVDEINALVTRYPHTPVMLTSRLASWRGRLAAGFHTLEVLDLGIDGIRQFVDHWFREEPHKAEGLWHELSRNTRLSTMAANPLLLSLIAIVYGKDLELPERRARLYARCEEVLLNQWDASRGVRRTHDFSTDNKRDLLEAVALHFHRRGQRYFLREDLLVVIADFLPTVMLRREEADRILTEICAQHGLLKEQTIGWYGFLHLTLQEHFCARAIHQAGALDLILENLHRPWWEEVPLLLASMGDAAPLLRGILEAPEDVFHGNLRLAGHCLAGRPRISEPALYAQIMAELHSRLRRACLRRAGLPTEAGLLARVVAELGGRENDDLLLALLAHEGIPRYVRVSIAAALGAQGEQSTVPHLLALLVDKKISRYVRGSIATALGTLGECNAAQPLLRLLADEEIDHHVRRSIADALGALGERSVLPRLLELLADRRVSRYLRGTIATALSTLGERSVVPSLLELLADKRLSRYVRGSIADALGALEERSIVPSLLELLADEGVSNSVRGRIADAIGTLGERGAVPGLLALLTDEGLDRDVRGSIAAAVGTLGERSIVPRLLELLADEGADRDVRERIAAVLGTLGQRKAIPRLLELLADERVNRDVRKKIAAALGALNEPNTVPRLLELLADEGISRYVRESIADALGALGERSAVPHMQELLTNEGVSRHVRWRIAAALGALGESSAVPFLLELLADERTDHDARWGIATALGALGDSAESARSLWKVLDREANPVLRERIYASLYQVSQQAGVRVLESGEVVPVGGSKE